jgi:hypothetical protein
MNMTGWQKTLIAALAIIGATVFLTVGVKSCIDMKLKCLDRAGPLECARLA